MAPDLDLRACPRCAAAARPGAPWCTQCFLPLGEPEPAPVEEAATEQAVPAEPDPVEDTAEPGSTDPRSWPCTSCGTRNALDDAECAACGLGFLSDLRTADVPLLVLPGVGDLGRFGRVQLLAGAVGFVVLAVLLMVLGAYLVV